MVQSNSQHTKYKSLWPIVTVCYQSPRIAFLLFCFLLCIPPSPFFDVVRKCEASSKVLEIMTVRKPFDDTEEGLGRIWKDSGEEQFIRKRWKRR